MFLCERHSHKLRHAKSVFVGLFDRCSGRTTSVTDGPCSLGQNTSLLLLLFFFPPLGPQTGRDASRKPCTYTAGPTPRRFVRGDGRTRTDGIFTPRVKRLRDAYRNWYNIIMHTMRSYVTSYTCTCRHGVAVIIARTPACNNVILLFWRNASKPRRAYNNTAPF